MRTRDRLVLTRTPVSRNGKLASRAGILAAFLGALFSVQAGLSQETTDPAPAVDPPGRVARISYLQGNVSLEPAGVDNFAQAELNYPVTVGDRVYVDLQALAELETAGLAVRLANGADVMLASLTDQVAQLGLAQGSIRVATRDLTAPDGTAGIVEIDTPNGSILVQMPGDIRVDSYPQDDSTVVTVTSGQVEIAAGAFHQTLAAGQSLQISGANPVSTQFVELLPPDPLDMFDQDRESLYQSSLSVQDQYVSPDMIGADDLDQYGDWTASADYGEVWYPRGVAVGWIPYRNGHWAWVAPWGWTWVEAEPWGFAPFHYGRWAVFGGRWGWVPGPPPVVVGRPVRPIYSPALVAFVGGPDVSLAIGFGGASGAGVTAWFPLGPREPYVPWYHASAVYVNRVNVTNLYSRDAAEVRSNYANRTSNVYAGNSANFTYVNRTVATTAVTQKDFAAGHAVGSSQALRLDASARAQLNQAPVLPHPLVTPAASIAAPQAAARALPPHVARPVLETRAAIAAERPAQAAEPVPSAPVKPEMPAPSLPQQRIHAPVAAEPAAAAAPNPTQRPPDQPRTLINRTEPQPVQPPFARQQEEIERNDPGRPLGPQQVENLRNGRPAGASPQPEPVQHPAPKPPPKPETKPVPKK